MYCIKLLNGAIEIECSNYEAIMDYAVRTELPNGCEVWLDGEFLEDL